MLFAELTNSTIEASSCRPVGIVLSSEWRRTQEMKDVVGMGLRSKGLPQLRDHTVILKPRLELLKSDPAIIWCERRAREIGSWLKMHPEVTSWVALDDLNFVWADSHRAAGSPVMKCRSVLTDAHQCLTDDDAKKAIDILLNPPELGEEDVMRHVAEAVRETQRQLGETGPLRLGA
eukprot:TRINITY_DN6410_c0_g1_i1.p1 TRINITY_DN6410_c0_g1~~TRINITY_DN6410_c0_g1_i1.p1  ORF type:complete len:176 (-),score=22.24 TRINITY_DN6410_c0_g1_i1:181-708(-)